MTSIIVPKKHVREPLCVRQIHGQRRTHWGKDTLDALLQVQDILHRCHFRQGNTSGEVYRRRNVRQLQPLGCPLTSNESGHVNKDPKEARKCSKSPRQKELKTQKTSLLPKAPRQLPQNLGRSSGSGRSDAAPAAAAVLRSSCALDLEEVHLLGRPPTSNAGKLPGGPLSPKHSRIYPKRFLYNTTDLAGQGP